MVKLANTYGSGPYVARLAGSSPVTRTKPEKSEPNFPNRKWVRIFYLVLITYIERAPKYGALIGCTII